MEAVPAAEPVLDPAKKPWALSAAILGGIYVVVSLSGLIFNLKNGSIPSSFAIQAYSLSAFSMLISIGFLIGGILILRGSNVGITILTYTPVAAIACLIIQVYFQYTFLHSDRLRCVAGGEIPTGGNDPRPISTSYVESYRFCAWSHSWN